MASDTASLATSEAPSSASTRHPLLNQWGQLYAFSLPTELLESLSLRSIALPSSEPVPEPPAPSDATPTNGATPQTGLTCALCTTSFESLEDQRDHFRTDWHRYNVKRQLKGSSGVGEKEFDGMVEGLEDSLSGSEDSESDDGSGNESGEEGAGKVERLLRKQKLELNGGASDEDEDGQPRVHGSPFLQLTATPLLPPTIHLSIFRCIFPTAPPRPDAQTDSLLLPLLPSLQTTPEGPTTNRKVARTDTTVEGGDEEPHWTLLMMGGGHFAAMVVRLRPRLKSLGKGKWEKEVVVLAHKTFHRYTTRRKQGGAQSAHDGGGKGAAKSAGAALRRYNEQALTDDIRTLLSTEPFSNFLPTSSLMFLRASKASAARTFFNPSSIPAPLTRSDPRLRTFPFPTRRPTLDELGRCFNELTKVNVRSFTVEQLEEIEAKAQSDAAKAKLLRAKPEVVEKEVKKEKEKLSEVEEARKQRWIRVLDMISRGKVDALNGFIASRAAEGEGTDPKVEWLGPVPSGLALGALGENWEVGWRALHVAAVADKPEMIEWLLEQGCDPTILTPFPVTAPPPTNDVADKEAPPTSEVAPAFSRNANKTPYELCPSRNTRNAFRRYYASHPDQWTWGPDGARVPSALTEEMEASQSGKGKDRKSRLKEKLREREKERELAAQQEAKRVEEEEKEREAKRREEKLNRVVKGPQRVGGASAVLVRDRKRVEESGLSEEQKMRLERERRARAAEARLGGAGRS